MWPLCKCPASWDDMMILRSRIGCWVRRWHRAMWGLPVPNLYKLPVAHNKRICTLWRALRDVAVVTWSTYPLQPVYHGTGTSHSCCWNLRFVVSDWQNFMCWPGGLPLRYVLVLVFFETSTCYVACAGLEFVLFLPLQLSNVIITGM